MKYVGGILCYGDNRLYEKPPVVSAFKFEQKKRYIIEGNNFKMSVIYYGSDKNKHYFKFKVLDSWQYLIIYQAGKNYFIKTDPTVKIVSRINIKIKKLWH